MKKSILASLSVLKQVEEYKVCRFKDAGWFISSGRALEFSFPQ